MRRLQLLMMITTFLSNQESGIGLMETYMRTIYFTNPPYLISEMSLAGLLSLIISRIQQNCPAVMKPNFDMKDGTTIYLLVTA